MKRRQAKIIVIDVPVHNGRIANGLWKFAAQKAAVTRGTDKSDGITGGGR